MEASHLLSDQFQQFAGEIAALHEQKKALNNELRKIVAEFKEKLSALDKQAIMLSDDFEEWKASHNEK